MRATILRYATVLLLLPAGASWAQDQATELAKATQNPVADLVSVPLQFNWFTGGDLNERTQSVLNFQPVFPLPVNDRWNVIARTIVPFVNIPLPGGGRSEGIADIQSQFFFTPARPMALVWGVGPIFSWPTATNDAINTGQFAAGPTAVLVKTTGPWVLGGLFSNMWRFAGSEAGQHINMFTMQPFINYNLPRGWSFSFSPIITANWSAPDDDDVWTVPLGLGLSKVHAIGKQPVNLGIQYYYNVERPAGAGDYQVRLIAAFLFPKARG